MPVGVVFATEVLSMHLPRERHVRVMHLQNITVRNQFKLMWDVRREIAKVWLQAGTLPTNIYCKCIKKEGLEFYDALCCFKENCNHCNH